MNNNKLFEEVLEEGTHSNKRPFESAWPAGEFPIPKPTGWANNNGSDMAKVRPGPGALKAKRDFQSQPGTNPPTGLGRSDYEPKYAQKTGCKLVEEFSESEEFPLLKDLFDGKPLRESAGFISDRECAIKDALADEEGPDGFFHELVERWKLRWKEIDGLDEDEKDDAIMSYEEEDEQRLVSLINGKLAKSGERCIQADEFDEIAAHHIYDFEIAAQGLAKERN